MSKVTLNLEYKSNTGSLYEVTLTLKLQGKDQQTLLSYLIDGKRVSAETFEKELGWGPSKIRSVASGLQRNFSFLPIRANVYVIKEGRGLDAIYYLDVKWY